MYGHDVLPGRYTRDQEGRLVEVEPPRPCPAVMTEDEALRYLRIDEVNIKNPQETLRRYRKQGLLRATQICKSVRYLKTELDQFLQRVTENNPR